MKEYRILVPTDFSHCSEEALKLAISIAKDEVPSQIYLAHIQHAIAPTYDDELGVFDPERLIASMKMAHAERAVAGNVQIEEIIKRGEPEKEILRLANDRNVDLIVMGTHGRRGISHLLVGSVAEHVLRQASCPVLTVKHLE